MPSELHQKNNEEKNKEVEEEEVKLKKILVPIDGSNYSMKAAKYAIEIAKLQRSQIIFIHIIEPFPYDFGSIGPTFDQYSKDVTNIAQSWFSKIGKMAETRDVNDVKTDVFPAKNSDTIIHAILNYASSNSIDLIVMGTKGTRGVGRFLLGGVANGVLQYAVCPVFIVK